MTEIDRHAVHDPSWPTKVDIYDTTLRDGSQLEGISLTVDDKLRIAEQLDHLGVGFIEGGWPGANPKDDEFFARARTELQLTTSEFVAFGSTRRAKGRVDEDQTLANLVGAGTSVVCIVGKCWDYHVTEAIRTTLDEGVAMVADSVAYLVGEGQAGLLRRGALLRRVPPQSRVQPAGGGGGGDGRRRRDRALRHQRRVAAARRGVRRARGRAARRLRGGHPSPQRHGVWCRQRPRGRARRGHPGTGTINGYGERVGNCDLVPIIANLELKMGIQALPEGHLERLTSVAHHVAELVNFTVDPQQPYVGTTAFAHKAGLHTSALSRRSDAYEHVAPETVGNGTRVLVSEMAGRSTLEMKAADLGLDIDGKALGDVIDTLKTLEHEGYHFEAADASLELLMRGAAGWTQPFFELESFAVSMDHRSGAGARLWNDVAVDIDTEAVVKLSVDDDRRVAVGEGNGPVNAIDAALRSALGDTYPALQRISLTDFKVRVLDTQKGTGAVTRVLLDSTNGDRTWTTIGVSENIIEASWQALVDSIVFGLLHTDA